MHVVQKLRFLVSSSLLSHIYCIFNDPFCATCSFICMHDIVIITVTVFIVKALQWFLVCCTAYTWHACRVSY